MDKINVVIAGPTPEEFSESLAEAHKEYKPLLVCAFCEKNQRQVAAMVQGQASPHPVICNECISQCFKVLADVALKPHDHWKGRGEKEASDNG